jgi:hypothetical protein
LTNRVTRLFALLGGFLNMVWLSGTDVYGARIRPWAESNPEEVQYSRR